MRYKGIKAVGVQGRVNLQLGVYLEIEAIVDLRSPGLSVTLHDSPNWEAQLRLDGLPHRRAALHPIGEEPPLRTFNLELLHEGAVHEDIRVWRWVANYWWLPPKTSVGLRRTDLTLARMNKKEYRLEVLPLNGTPTQYILDKATVKILEESLKAHLAQRT